MPSYLFYEKRRRKGDGSSYLLLRAGLKAQNFLHFCF